MTATLRCHPHIEFHQRSLPAFSPASTLAAAFARQSVTASLQSSPAVRAPSLGTRMHGGTALSQVFKQTFAAAPSPHSISNTLLAQHAFTESCPLTLLHVG